VRSAVHDAAATIGGLHQMTKSTRKELKIEKKAAKKAAKKEAKKAKKSNMKVDRSSIPRNSPFST